MSFLPDHRDRLRQQPAAPRHGVREDHGRRHRPLQAALRGRDALPDGQRRALAERLRSARELRRRSAGVLRPHGAGVPRRVAAPVDLVRRLHPHDRAAPQGRRAAAGAGVPRRAATSTRASTKAGTASPARRSSRRRTSSTASARSTSRKPEWIREKNYFFRLSKYQQPLLEHYAAHPGVHPAGDAPQRDPAAGRERASRTSRSAAPGSPGASRCRSTESSVVYVWFDALINYASAVGYGTDDEQFAQWWPADLHVDRQGHHAVPLRRLAGDADERRPRRCRARCSATAGCTSRASR